MISIHAPLAGRDYHSFPEFPCCAHFNPRAPRGARFHFDIFANAANVISIHAPLAGRDCMELGLADRYAISIHAPLAGRDCSLLSPVKDTGHFNPRAPRGARLPKPTEVENAETFQSTRPSRGATRYIHNGLALVWPFQSTRPSRGATLDLRQIIKRVTISIHAPLAGRDINIFSQVLMILYFNPRAPRGARRPPSGSSHGEPPISIHAPLAGRDAQN